MFIEACTSREGIPSISGIVVVNGEKSRISIVLIAPVSGTPVNESNPALGPVSPESGLIAALAPAASASKTIGTIIIAESITVAACL